MILDSNVESIEILLGGAVTTNQLPFVATYADHTATTFVPGNQHGVTNDTTVVTMISAPAAATQRQVKMLNIFNADTVAATVTIRFNDNTVIRNLIVVTLGIGFQLVYTDVDGWSIRDASGRPVIYEVLSDLAIPKSLVTAKGDLIIATANSVPDNLAKSSKDFQQLYTKNSETTGLKWGLRKYLEITIFEYTVDVLSGDGRGYVHIPAHLDGLDLVEVHAEVITAGTTGTMNIQFYNIDNALDMLNSGTGRLSIDTGETGSDTAADPAVINTSNDHVNENDMIRIDVDTIHTTPAKGLIITAGFA